MLPPRKCHQMEKHSGDHSVSKCIRKGKNQEYHSVNDWWRYRKLSVEWRLSWTGSPDLRNPLRISPMSVGRYYFIICRLIALMFEETVIMSCIIGCVLQYWIAFNVLYCISERLYRNSFSEPLFRFWTVPLVYFHEETVRRESNKFSFLV